MWFESILFSPHLFPFVFCLLFFLFLFLFDFFFFLFPFGFFFLLVLLFFLFFIFRDISKMQFSSQDVSGSKAFSTFLVRLSEIVPRIVNKKKKKSNKNKNKKKRRQKTKGKRWGEKRIDSNHIKMPSKRAGASYLTATCATKSASGSGKWSKYGNTWRTDIWAPICTRIQIKTLMRVRTQYSHAQTQIYTHILHTHTETYTDICT